MDRIRQRVNNAYNENYGYLLMGLWVFLLIVWGAVASFGYMHLEQQEAHPALLILLMAYCAIGWACSAISSIRAIEFWLRTPQVRRAYDPGRDGRPDSFFL